MTPTVPLPTDPQDPRWNSPQVEAEIRKIADRVREHKAGIRPDERTPPRFVIRKGRRESWGSRTFYRVRDTLLNRWASRWCKTHHGAQQALRAAS